VRCSVNSHLGRAYSLGTTGTEVCVLLLQGWPTGQRPRATFLIVSQQRATSYTRAHMNITPSLPHSHILLFLSLFAISFNFTLLESLNDSLRLCFVPARHTRPTSYVNWLTFQTGLPDLFFQKRETFSKKGQKRPTKLLKKAKHN